MSEQPATKDERLRRWTLVLGGDQAAGTGVALEGVDLEIDRALAELYDRDNSGKAGLGASAPKAARWLGDIRRLFPASIVQVLQHDAIERMDLKRILKQPELLKAITPDVHLVAKLLALQTVLPTEARETAREVVGNVTRELSSRLAEKTRRAVAGGLKRASRTSRPRPADIDWNRTIRANLKHYQPESRTIIPERRFGKGAAGSSIRELILCVDQSGSMAASVVYAGVFASVLAGLPALKTSVVVYDTSVVDLTAEIHDPVDLLFGVQLGGGTDTTRALDYCRTLIRSPRETIFVLISDLYDGVSGERMVAALAELAGSGARAICLLALADDGAPAYDSANAHAIASLGIPVFACTPDLFPDLMAAAIERRDLHSWASERGIATARPDHPQATI